MANGSSDVSRGMQPRLIFQQGRIEIWQVDDEFAVYGVTVSGDPIWCPSLGMAHEVAAR
jgi:hypothetical protein